MKILVMIIICQLDKLQRLRFVMMRIGIASSYRQNYESLLKSGPKSTYPLSSLYLPTKGQPGPTNDNEKDDADDAEEDDADDAEVDDADNVEVDDADDAEVDDADDAGDDKE